MRLTTLLAAACLALLAIPTVAANHEDDDPAACEGSTDDGGVCADYCMYGLGPSYGVAVLHDGDVLRVWIPPCPVM